MKKPGFAFVWTVHYKTWRVYCMRRVSLTSIKTMFPVIFWVIVGVVTKLDHAYCMKIFRHLFSNKLFDRYRFLQMFYTYLHEKVNVKIHAVGAALTFWKGWLGQARFLLVNGERGSSSSVAKWTKCTKYKCSPFKNCKCTTTTVTPKALHDIAKNTFPQDRNKKQLKWLWRLASSQKRPLNVAVDNPFKF